MGRYDDRTRELNIRGHAETGEPGIIESCDEYTLTLSRDCSRLSGSQVNTHSAFATSVPRSPEGSRSFAFLACAGRFRTSAMRSSCASLACPSAEMVEEWMRSS